MRCFVHREQEALAICKQCGKALCSACLVDSPDGVTCSGSCEERLKLYTSAARDTQRGFSASKQILRVLAAGTVVLGIMLIVIGFTLERIQGIPIFLPVALLSSLLCVVALLVYLCSTFFLRD
jgi:hypothetical protein